MMKWAATFFISLCYITCTLGSDTKIHDPFNIFCGNLDCYDLLELDVNGANRSLVSNKDIKRAYRRLSLTSHPG